MTIGKEIRRLRKEKGLTLVELSVITGVSNPYISQIETEKFNPSPEILKELSNALKISKLYLYKVAGYLDDTDILELVEDNERLRQSLQSACDSLGADVEDYLSN